jgi:hypothetical protein
MGTGALSPGVKQKELEAYHSPPISAEIKKTWVYTSTPPILLHGVVFRDNFTFHLTLDKRLGGCFALVSLIL